MKCIMLKVHNGSRVHNESKDIELQYDAGKIWWEFVTLDSHRPSATAPPAPVAIYPDFQILAAKGLLLLLSSFQDSSLLHLLKVTCKGLQLRFSYSSQKSKFGC